MTAMRRLLPLALLSAATALGLGIGRPVHAQSPTEGIVVAVSKTPLSLPMYVADREGYFTAEGVSVRLNECLGGHRCLSELVEGRADLAAAGDAPIMFRSFATREFRILATLATTWNDLKLVARPGAGILRPPHLEGRTVGVVRGASSQYFLDSYLLLYGIDPHEVRIVPMQPEEAVPLLAASKVDAISIWEPFAYEAVTKHAATVVPSESVYNLTWNLVASTRALQNRPAQLAAVMRAVRRAERFIQASPPAAQAVLRERLALDQRFIDWVWPAMHFRLSLDQALIKTLESQARWAIQEGHIAARQPPNYLELIDEGPLKKIEPAAVGFVR